MRVKTMTGTPMELNYYALLGIDRDAHGAAVEAAFLAALERQPKSRVGRLAWFFYTGESEQALREAYETLIDPEARRNYDNSLAAIQFTWIPPG